jgi:hypothetical protein
VLCFGTHDCELNFADVSGIESDPKFKPKPEKLLLKGNPLMKGYFIGEDTVVAGGWDKVPIVFKKSGSEWRQDKILDMGINEARKAKITGNKFLDQKVYFNADMKLGSNV